MLGKIVTSFFSALLFISIVTLAFNIQPVKSTWTGTVYIRADGSIDPPDAPIKTHDNVTYTLTDNITSSGDGIVVERDNIIIDGASYTIQGPGGTGYGIDLSSRSNVSIKNTNIRNFFRGIMLASSSNNKISNSNITANLFEGILVDRSSNNTLLGNNITNNGRGIWLDYSSYNMLEGNRMSDNGQNFGVDGSYINYVDDSNTVDDKPIYYWISEKDKTIPFDAGCVILVYCEGIKVQNLMLTKNMRGIQLIYTKNSTITKNNITNCHDGISLDRSSNHNTITENNIISNRNGLFISYLSKYNVISKNKITVNYKGIIFSESSDNTIYHNTFTDNTQHVYSYASANVWDDGYPSGGNYWSNYNGTDLHWGSGQNETGSDGIGDTAYVIDESNADRYPLMGPSNSFNTSVGYPVDIVSNSTIQNFQYFKSNRTIIMHVSNMTANQTVGFCRLTIPHDVISPPYTVKVNGTTLNFQTIYENYTEGISIIYFTYEHSNLEITVIPEFSSAIILPLFTLTTIIATILLKKKRKTKSQLP